MRIIIRCFVLRNRRLCDYLSSIIFCRGQCRHEIKKSERRLRIRRNLTPTYIGIIFCFAQLQQQNSSRNRGEERPFDPMYELFLQLLVSVWESNSSTNFNLLSFCSKNATASISSNPGLVHSTVLGKEVVEPLDSQRSSLLCLETRPFERKGLPIMNKYSCE